MSIANNMGSEERRERGRGRKAFWIIMGAALLIGVVFAAWSPRHGYFGAYRAHSAVAEWNVESLLDAIDATEEQRSELRPALERARRQVQRIVVSERELRAGLLGALEAAELDSTDVSRFRTSAIQLSESVIDTVLESTVEIWSALTPDQRAEVLRHWRRRS